MAGIHHPTNEVSVDLGKLFASLAANWLRIVLVAIGVTAVALAVTRNAMPRYQGETRLLIETRQAGFLRPGAGALNDRPILDEEGLTSQAEVIASADILKQVARKLQLFRLAEFDQAAETTVIGKLLVAAGLLSDPAELSPEEHILKAMREKLNVYRLEKSRVIVIEFSSGDPRLAADVPNALADAYIAVRRDTKLPGDARIFSRAIIAAEPDFPKMLPIVGAAFAASLLVMAIVILLQALFSGRAMRPGHGAKPGPIVQVLMPAAVDLSGTDEQGAEPQRPVASGKEAALYARREVDIKTAAERLITGGAARAVVVSPEGDKAAATAAFIAREVSHTGLRVLLLDLTASGAASLMMLRSRFHAGITNLLASEAQFSDVIHADRYSDCHVIPLGTADLERALRAADRLPIIMNSLTTAYDVVIVECGAADAAGIRRLVSDDTEIMVSVLEPDGAAVAESIADLASGGCGRLTRVSPLGYERSGSSVRSAA